LLAAVDEARAWRAWIVGVVGAEVEQECEDRREVARVLGWVNVLEGGGLVGIVGDGAVPGDVMRGGRGREE